MILIFLFNCLIIYNLNSKQKIIKDTLQTNHQKSKVKKS